MNSRVLVLSKVVEQGDGAHLLISPGLGVLAEELLNVLYAAHFFVDLLQHGSTLLQPI